MNIKSTAIFDFLLKKFLKLIKFITQSYLFITSEFIFILEQIFCLSKKPRQLLFQKVCLQSLLSRFLVLISCNMWSSNHFSISSCFPCFSGSRFFRVQVFQGPGFSGSGSRVQGPESGPRVQSPGPSFRSSRRFADLKSCYIS